MKLSFVIPCYNSSKTIERVVEEIWQITKKNKYKYEIILINDGSTDNTFEIIKKICKKDINIKGINLTKNFGQHSAQMAGFKFARGDIIVSVDDDGETPVLELEKLLQKLNEGFDVVFAKYVERKQTFLREFGSWLNYRMAEILTDKPKGLYTSNFYLMKSFVKDEMIRYVNAYPYIAGLIFRTTQKIANVPIKYRGRFAGKSNYSIKKMIMLWLNGFTAFSVKPMRISSAIGIFTAGFGFVFGVYIILRKIFDTKYILSGWSSIMSALFILTGIIMLLLGLIGEYIARIYICINNSPQYVIKETINIKKLS